MAMGKRWDAPKVNVQAIVIKPDIWQVHPFGGLSQARTSVNNAAKADSRRILK